MSQTMNLKASSTKPHILQQGMFFYAGCLAGGLQVRLVILTALSAYLPPKIGFI